MLWEKGKLGKKKILFICMIIVLFFTSIGLDHSGRIELIKEAKATVGSHWFTAIYHRAYIHDDHDSLWMGAGEWTFWLIRPVDNRGDMVGDVSRNMPGYCDFPDLSLSWTSSSDTWFLCLAYETDGLVWDYESRAKVPILISEVTPNQYISGETQVGDVTHYYSYCLHNSAPTVSISGPNVISDREHATFTATGMDPDGDSIEYHWVWQKEGQSRRAAVLNRLSTYDFQNHPPGTYTIMVRVEDALGTYSDWATTTITVKEDTPPTGSILINSGADCTTAREVILTLSATDDTSVEEMSIVETGPPIEGAWEPYATSKSWILGEGDGIKTVNVVFKDKFGLMSYASDSILLDTIPPIGSIVINGGASSTSSLVVLLSLTYEDATSGVDKVRYTNDDEWDSEVWEDPQRSMPWGLTSIEGEKFVSYQVKDSAGLISETYRDSITLSKPPPSPEPSAPPEDPPKTREAAFILISVILIVAVSIAAIWVRNRRKQTRLS